MTFVGQVSSCQAIEWAEVLLAVGKVLSTTSPTEKLLSWLVRTLVETVPPADAAMVCLYDKTHQQLIGQASYGYASSDVKCSLRPKEGAAGQCYAKGKPLLFSSVESVIEQAATLGPASLDSYNKMREGLPQTLSMIAIPLISRQEILGVILLEHYKQHRPFDNADLSQLEILGSWLSLIIGDMQAHLELMYYKRSYRKLLGKFIAASEEERRKIAREIHDEVNQLLLSVMLNLEDIENILPADLAELRERLKSSRTNINQVFDDLRELSLSLRPPELDELGLPQALDGYIDSLSEKAALPITLEVSGLRQRRPAPVVETELFRIAQEALSNVIKHAQAASARVKLNFGRSRLVLVIEDDGSGFDSSALLSISGKKRNLGLLGMMERAELCGGSLKINSAPGSGTRLRVEIPVSSYNWGVY